MPVLDRYGEQGKVVEVCDSKRFECCSCLTIRVKIDSSESIDYVYLKASTAITELLAKKGKSYSMFTGTSDSIVDHGAPTVITGMA